MIIANNKPIVIVGYKQSSMTHEFEHAISKTHDYSILEPDQYMDFENKHNYQYIVASWKDFDSRKIILEHVDDLDLDLVTYIDETAVIVGNVGPGSFVHPFSKVSIQSTVGKHCIVCSYSLIGHYCSVGDGCVIRPGVLLVGKSTIGKNCVLNARSTVCNAVHVCADTEIMGFSAVTKDITKPGVYLGTPARLRIK
jgi:UDP-3-O-[3-hydroxymyristoyl] glucosamine N-acyltransferase